MACLLAVQTLAADPSAANSEAKLIRVADQPEWDRIGRNAGTLKRFLNGTTHKTFDSQHGTQIVYLGKNRNAYLWYPGNRHVLRGRWRTEQIGSVGAKICFKYPSASGNPATGQRGGRWQCAGGTLHLLYDTEIRRGDPLALSTGRLPFVMPRATNMSIQEAYSRTGGQAPLSANLVTWPTRSR